MGALSSQSALPHGAGRENRRDTQYWVPLWLPAHSSVSVSSIKLLVMMLQNINVLGERITYEPK